MKRTNKARSNRSQLFKILSDENRLRILEELMRGEQNVGDLAAKLKLEQSLLSHHLSALREHNLVIANRQGKEIYYSISDQINDRGASKKINLDCCSISLK
jgi:DNA-binding transcriptional ArsR family regulator